MLAPGRRRRLLGMLAVTLTSLAATAHSERYAATIDGPPFRTGSLFIAMLMHAGLTATARTVMPTGLAGASLLAIDLGWFAALCIVIGAVALSDRARCAARLGTSARVTWTL